LSTKTSSRPKQYTAKNPKAVAGFTAAMKKSLEYASAHPDEARAILATYTKIGPTVQQNLTLSIVDRRFLPPFSGMVRALGVPLLRAVTASTVEFLRPIPSVALIPLVVLIYGSRPQSALVLVVYAAFWQVLYGVADVDPVVRDTARSYRFSRWAVIRTVLWPTAVPYVVTGFRLAAAVALILEITTELVIGVPGPGNRPTVVLADVPVDLPDDRDQLATRSSPRLAEIRGHVYELIQLAKKGHRPTRPDPPDPPGSLARLAGTRRFLAGRPLVPPTRRSYRA
jgi:hypothetical protein